MTGEGGGEFLKLRVCTCARIRPNLVLKQLIAGERMLQKHQNNERREY